MRFAPPQPGRTIGLGFCREADFAAVGELVLEAPR
jgi:hypothetical protein